MADSLQTLIRSLPACFTGQAAADFTASVAKQVKEQAPGLDTPSSWTDYIPAVWAAKTAAGAIVDEQGSRVYSTEKIIAAANELDLYGNSLRFKAGQPFCKASEERNRIITLLGNVYGLVGARIAVNATLAAAKEGLKDDLIKNAKDVVGDVFDYGKWLVVGLVAIAAIVIVMEFK